MSHNIDKIFYINLNRRTDRRNEIEEELNNMGLQFERFSAIETDNGTIGCGYSHLSVLKLARDGGYKNVLILEDDFQFLVDKPEFEDYLTKLFNNSHKFDACFLSYGCMTSEEIPEASYIKRVLDSQTASGYIVNQHYIPVLIKLYEKSIPLLESTEQHWNYANDTAWKPLQKTDMWICFDKRIGKQRASFSDTFGRYMEYPDA